MDKKTASKTPETLLGAIRYFSDPDVALAFMAGLRWPNGVTCPSCAAADPSFLKTRRIWKCRECKKQFSVKVGTLFEDSPIGLDKWLPCVWLIANCKNGVSSHELARSLGVTQKTAWFMLHRIRLAMQTESFDKMRGEIEVDETFIGGKAKFMHRDKRERVLGNARASAPGKGKVMVLGALERTTDKKHSTVRALILPGKHKDLMFAHVRENVEAGSSVYTDSLQAYKRLDREYDHEFVDHTVKQYVRGRVHTNGLENFWSLLKRSIKGTYVSVEPFHLFRYLDEQMFRFNARKGTDGSRFVAVARNLIGKRLTYKELIGADMPALQTS